MSRYAQEALGWSLLLELGLAELSAVIAWADQILGSHQYDNWIAEVALGESLGKRDMIAFLRQFEGSTDEWSALRKIGARMCSALSENPSCGPAFAFATEKMIRRHSYETPPDLHFLLGLDEDYHLAESGYGSIEEISAAFAENLRTLGE